MKNIIYNLSWMLNYFCLHMITYIILVWLLHTRENTVKTHMHLWQYQSLGKCITHSCQFFYSLKVQAHVLCHGLLNCIAVNAEAAAANVMNQQLSFIHDWLVNHRISISWFCIGRQKKQQSYPSISINDVNLQTIQKQKYLGLIFDSRLSWDYQVRMYVCKKMSYYLHLIKSHSKVLNHHITKLVIDSLAFSHLVYVLSVWGPSVKQRLQCDCKIVCRHQNQLKDCNVFRTRLLGYYTSYSIWIILQGTTKVQNGSPSCN